MAEIVLRDGETYSYDIAMLLRDFFWGNQELFLAAYIDGYEIEHREVDTDNIERRWFCIRRVNTEDSAFNVIDVGVYPAGALVYVKLFGVDHWNELIKETNALIAKHGNS